MWHGGAGLGPCHEGMEKETKKKNGMAMQAVMGSAQARQPKKTPRPSSMQ